MGRRRRGDETAQRLLHWSDSQKAAERLAGHILAAEGFSAIDPTHPLGGPDRLSDLVCVREDKRWAAAAYFPNGQKKFGAIRRKFKRDVAPRDDVDGVVFVTNQYLRLAEREQLVRSSPGPQIELFHLERIARILDSPVNYGIRLEFLDIEMSKEEQLAFFGSVANVVAGLRIEIERLAEIVAAPSLEQRLPAEELEKFRGIVQSLVGYPSALVAFGSPIDRLRPPLQELEQFERKVQDLTGGSFFLGAGPVARLHPPLAELEEYERRLRQLTGDPIMLGGSPVDRLRPPVELLREYEEQLDAILEKLRLLRKLQPPITSAETKNEPENSAG